MAWVTAYLLAAHAARELGVFGALSIWYAPAGVALAAGALRRWAALPSLAVGEVLVGLLVYPGLAPGLVVLNGIAYAFVYTLAGVLVRAYGATAVEPGQRRPVLASVLGALAAPAGAALVGVGFRALNGDVETGSAGQDLLLWWVGDTIGVLTFTLAIIATVVRARRGERWWALTGSSLLRSAVVALVPAAVITALALLADDVVPFAALVFAPYLLVAVLHGLPGVALAAPPTSVALTVAANRTIGPQVLARTDLQVLLATLLLAGLGMALVTEERAALRRSLRQRARHLRHAQTQARVGSFLWDVPSGRVWWSDGMLHLLGRLDEQQLPEEQLPRVVGDYLDAVHPDDRAAYDRVLTRAVAEHDGYDHVHRVVRADGATVVVRARGEVEVRDGNVQQVLGTCTDVTREEQVAERLGAALVREQAARVAEERAVHEIARAEGVKDALLVAVSHEVRTPLTIVRGLSETLRRAELAGDTLAEHREHLATLERHARRLQDVLVDLLDVDRLGRGVVDPVRRPVSLPDLVLEVTRDLATSERVEVDVPDAVVELDGRLLARIIEHLLTNALRHGPPTTPVVLDVELDGELLRLVVEDHGPGIPHDARSEVFVPFARPRPDLASPGAGTGLSLVRGFAELHHGRAWADGRRDGSTGTAIHVELPVAPQVHADV